MSVVVTDRGFASDDWAAGFVPWQDRNPESDAGLDVDSATDPAALDGRFAGVAMIRVAFPSSADGRGFTIAARLRRMGYDGRLRAAGHVLADQYAMARRSGFDEVEISDDLARRQPESQWMARADWRALDYRARLRG